MPKMSIESARHVLSGPTMGTRWSAIVYAPPGFDARPATEALASGAGRVDDQMSTWKPESDLMRLNATAPGRWMDIPPDLMTVLDCALSVGRLSGGAFDIAVGDAVSAWGFRAGPPDPARIRAATAQGRRPAYEIVELDAYLGRARLHGSAFLDLSGIAKGYAVDRMAETLLSFGIQNALVALDGELRALGTQSGGVPWSIAVERPDPLRRAPLAVIALREAAVATSGDYRHWIDMGTQRLSHTMDPRSGAPLASPPASVTVVAQSCMKADAWATALTVLGAKRGAELARRTGLDVLFLERSKEGLTRTAVGTLFSGPVKLGEVA